jgi:hypothetical protein
MNIYSTLQIGEFHLNHCEDYLITEKIGNNKILMAVMDGCTMANDSYFVATLVGKILKRICKTKGYTEFYGLNNPILNTEQYLKSIIQELFSNIKLIRNQLLLEQKDLLTTLIILLIDKQDNHGIVLAIGDGIVSINGQITEFDQDNKPDYLGFHLNEDFEKWYAALTQKIYFQEVTDISIATDGMLMFKKFRNEVTDPEIDPIDFLMKDQSGNNNEDMLEQKLKQLEHIYGLRPTDDLAIIRVLS